jgi:hypothetical protein
MKPHTRVLLHGAIRQFRGLLTLCEKWVETDYLEGLPVGTPEEVMEILSSKRNSAPVTDADAGAERRSKRQ